MTRQDIKRGLIPEDLLKFRWLDKIALDPTGTRVAYTVRQPYAETNGYVTHLYIRDVVGTTALKVTKGVGNASSPTWDKDGKQLAYSWSTAENHAVHIWSDDVETHYDLMGSAMTSLEWSPSGNSLVGVRWTAVRAEDERGPRAGIPAPTIKVVRRLRYKQDGVGFVHEHFAQIWVLDLTTGDLTQITDSECDYSEPTWSHQGDKLAFVGLAREQNIALGLGQIFICNYPDGELTRLLPNWQGACRSPVWGEGDSLIAFAGHNHPAPTNRRVFMTPHIADVQAGTAKELIPNLDQEVGNYAVSDSRAGLSNITVKWPAADPWIYFLLTVQGATQLHRVNPLGMHEILVEGPQVVFDYSPAANSCVAYGMATPASPGELYLHQGSETSKTTQLTSLNPWLRDHRLAAPEEYWFAGLEDAKVHGWLLKPPHFDETKTYPTIVYVHCSMFSWDFSHEFQCLVNSGYVLTYFNQRGTTAGYGQAWTRASEGDQGGKDYEETMLGVNDLSKRAYVDADRLGVTGGSCGGFMTNWIVGHTDRFATAVTQRSITNQVSFFGTSDIGPECTEAETGRSPLTSIETSWRQSPIAYAKNITTPLLIIHSDEDYRCPLEQAEQLFAALRWLGKEVELVIFEGESHGLSRGGRPGNRIERQRRILSWFDKYLK
ncbi:MAG: S9 family peptidase [Deinococcota bacterium]